MPHPDTTPTHTLAELCVLVDLPLRTVRYYLQIGLVDRPEGETRAARYGPRQLEQLLLIKKWSAAGLALERIRALLHGEPAPVAAAPPALGTVQVRSHLAVAPGVEVVIEPTQAGLSPEQVRHFVQQVMALWQGLHTPPPTTTPPTGRTSP